MKRVYTKPLVFIEDRSTGKIMSNSGEYAERMQEKLEEFRKEQEREREN